MKPVATEIHRRLSKALAPTLLDVRDDSASHRGHAGHIEGVETHFTVHVVSSAFDGQSRVERQRLVHGLLADLMDNPIHALSLKLDSA